MNIQDMVILQKGLRNLIGNIDRYLFYVKRQRFHRASESISVFWRDFAGTVSLLSEHLSDLNGEEPVLEIENLLAVIKELQTMEENRDYVMAADLFEIQIMPVFLELEGRIGTALGMGIDETRLIENVKCCSEKNPQLLYSLLPEQVIQEILAEEKISDEVLEQVLEITDCFISRGVAVEQTSGGYPTLVLEHGGHIYYMHTNGHVIGEAMCLAQEWLLQEKEEYSFYGFGLGYPFAEMLRMDYTISVRIFETNRELLFFALLFAPLNELYKTGRFELIYDPTGNRIKRSSLDITEERGFYIFYPALMGIKKKALREHLENYFVEEGSVRAHAGTLFANFKKNIRVETEDVNELFASLSGKDIVIVAAGPSLDKNIEVLKNKRDRVLVLAVGTVLKKLLKEGIRPDYVIFSDAYRSMYVQIKGAEDCGVPMIFLSTVHSDAVRDYQGKKYILYQKGFAPAEAMAESLGIPLVESGGSVSTVALDLCLKAGAKKIIFIGLDLAYTGAEAHASATAGVRKVSSDTGVYVESVDGGQVQTAKNLQIYLRWIEKRIFQRTEEEKEIPVIDATEGGAKKRCIPALTLDEALGNPQEGELCEEETLCARTTLCDRSTPDVRKKVSVIIPVYKPKQRYIARLMDSIVRQTIGFQDIEVIFVSDGDNSEETKRILSAWEEQYPDNVMLIFYDENRKPGYARTLGIEYANGKYVAFVDQDDWISLEMYELLYKKAEEEDCEMAGGKHARDMQYEPPETGKTGDVKSVVWEVDGAESRKEFFRHSGGDGYWCYLYRRDFLFEHNIYFIAGLTYDDNFFGALCRYYVKKLVNVDFVVYHWFVNRRSISMSRNGTTHFDRLKVQLALVHTLKERGFFETYHDEIEYSFLRIYYFNTLYLFFSHMKETPYQTYLDMRAAVEEEFPGYASNPFLAPGNESSAEYHKKIFPVVYQYYLESGNQDVLERLGKISEKVKDMTWYGTLKELLTEEELNDFRYIYLMAPKRGR